MRHRVRDSCLELGHLMCRDVLLVDQFSYLLIFFNHYLDVELVKEKEKGGSDEVDLWAIL